MELRHLHAFHVLAQELNFTRAADRLRITQQTLSAQLQQLESRVGASLFDRTTRVVALTDAGRTLLEHVPSILAAVDRAVVETLETMAGERGSLTVGLAGVAGLDLTPRTLRDFAEERPMIELSVRNVDFADPSGGLSSRDVDVALLWLPAPEDIEAIPLLDDVRMAVLAADHPLAAKDEISAAELAEQPFVWIEGMDPVNRDYWTLAEHRGGRPARIGATITGFEDLFAAVRAGQAVSASPSMVVGSLPWPDIAIRPITGLAPTTLAVCHRRGDERHVVQAFVRSAVSSARRS